MGRGAHLTLVNQTDAEITFGTSDITGPWTNNTFVAVQGTVAPHGQSPQFYIESAFGLYSSNVKVWAHPTGQSGAHFANAHLRQTDGGYQQVDTYRNHFRAEAVVQPHPGGGHQDDIVVYVSYPLNRNSWLADLNQPNRLVSALNLPGTHDSGARDNDVADFDGTTRRIPFSKQAWAQCQELTITEQLNQGIRFLDIRLSSLGHLRREAQKQERVVGVLEERAAQPDDTLLVVHGKILYSQSFADVLKECRQFLQANHGECLLMSVKSDGCGFDDAQWGAYAQDALFYTGCGWPTLQQAAGKIVLLRRFDPASTAPGFYFEVPDNTAYEEKSFRRPNCATDYHYTVQDRYNVNLELEMQKTNSVREFMDKCAAAATQAQAELAAAAAPARAAAQARADRLLVSFTSFVGKYSGASTAWQEVPYPRQAADRLTPWLAGELQRRGKAHLGVLVMDFAAPVVIDTIIRSNHP